MEIPDPLAYFLIISTIGSFIISAILFVDKYHPKMRLVPWRRIGLSISGILYVFGGVYLIFFSFVASYMIMEYTNPETSFIAKSVSIEFSYLWSLTTMFLLMGLLWFLAGMSMFIEGLKFLKNAGLAAQRVERIALKLSNARILKENVI